MFPIGLQFQSFRHIQKIPMRLETLSVEEQKGHFYKTLGIEYHTPDKKRKSRKIKTKIMTNTKNKTKKI